MSSAGKAWSELLVMQDLEDMMSSSSGSILSGATLKRGSETYTLPTPKADSAETEDAEEARQGTSQPNSNVVAVENAVEGEDTELEGKDVESFGVAGNFRKRKHPQHSNWKNNNKNTGDRPSPNNSVTSLKNRRRRQRRPSNESAGSGGWNYGKRVKQGNSGQAQSSDTSSPPLQSFPGGGQGKCTPKFMLTKDYDQEAFFNTAFPVDVSLQELAKSIADALGEQLPEVVMKAVEYAGKEKSISLFDECRKVEKAGGMLINNGRRRRTPGGVFLQLFKTDKEISEDTKNQLMEFGKDLQRLQRTKDKEVPVNAANDGSKTNENNGSATAMESTESLDPEPSNIEGNTTDIIPSK